MHHFFRSLTLSAALLASAPAQEAGHTFEIGKDSFLLDGEFFQIRCGEIHSTRVAPEYWRHRLKMCKAMGMNTVCAYMFWNFHERSEGEYTWTGRADIAEFCRIAQEEGLWVLLRPGPYACAEWEMGGLPWWLLKHEDIALRSTDPRFLEATERYFGEVHEQLGPLQVTEGGPILMVQVENEYGFYGEDSDYMQAVHDIIKEAGFDVPLFTCNPTHSLRNGYIEDAFPVVNFGGGAERAFSELRKILPEGPLMCGEFYPGWFDTWGNPHHTGNPDRMLGDLEYMLENKASFSIYMAHGGTTFGLWAGADRPFKPDTSSYDYDAPISEAGRATEKFHRTRELMGRFLLPGEELGEIPAPNPTTTFDGVRLASVAPVFGNLPEPTQTSGPPRTYELYDQAKGMILYRTTLPAGPAATVEAAAVHDFGFAFLDGERLGVLDRRKRKFSLRVPQRSEPATLDILVYTMGRVNFGKEVHDRKGLHTPVRLKAESTEELEDWTVFQFPLTPESLAELEFKSGESPDMPSFHRGTFTLGKAADTWLDMRPWGKGVVWVNGHCLGRYWNIGPTQTMYVPGPWLKQGENEILVLDVAGPQEPVIAGIETPILNQLRPELDFGVERRAKVTVKLDGVEPAVTGSFPEGGEVQTVKFAEPASGRFFCIEALSEQSGEDHAAIAELDLLDAGGRPISHEKWTIAFVDSEERASEDGTAENAIDGQTANFWHTRWSSDTTPHPHRLIIDLGQGETVSGFRYVPRGDRPNGRIKDFRAYLGDGLVSPAE